MRAPCNLRVQLRHVTSERSLKTGTFSCETIPSEQAFQQVIAEVFWVESLAFVIRAVLPGASRLLSM